ncbi:hypothetical protein B0H13DRAFT_2059192 [Mycena leptocephala]|nr:hypothetical protein B0H13DRAFT_2059192 [Mycena leptocephala]
MQLSQELVDLIIDYLVPESFLNKHPYSDSENAESGDDAPRRTWELDSVAMCGLVCKKWLPRSRFHLFSSTKLSNETGTDNIQSFFRLLAGSPLPLLSFVQSLDLDLVGGPLRDEEMTRLHNLRILTSMRIRTAAFHTPKELQQEFYESLMTHIPFIAIGSPLLSCFHLDLSTDLPLPILIHLVSSMPSLEYLRIGSGNHGEKFDILEIDSETPPTGSFPPGLLALEVNLARGAGLLFAWLLSLPVLPILRSLALTLCLMPGEYPLAVSLHPLDIHLRRAGSELESLSLSLSGLLYDPDDDLGEVFKFERRLLESASRLRVLNFTTSQNASILPEILGFLPASRLSTLTVAVQYSGEEMLPIWEQMDRALAHPKFEALETFALEDTLADLKEDISLLGEEARTAMPMANARGILYSRFGGSN